MEFHTNIWDLLAYKIAKRMSKDKNLPLTIGLIREISDELRIFNETLVVKIYFRLPNADEMEKIENEMLELVKNEVPT